MNIPRAPKSSSVLPRKRSARRSSWASSRDGEYKLTGLGKDGVDYSSYIGQINYNYSITVNGSECTFEMQGYKTSAKIDQKKHTISSAGIGTLEFTAEGNNITLNLSDYTMTFTRQ